jgi:hypothetical protein
MPGSSDAGPRELPLLAQACLIDRRSPRTRDSWIMAALPTSDQPDSEVLAGIIERVTFHNAETGFCVLRVKARGHRDLATVVGHSATISSGEWITASGDWINDRKHGQQFKVHFLRTSAPISVEGIERYLASGMIRGICQKDGQRLRREGVRHHRG